MDILTFTFNPFSENTYLILGPGQKATIIDPGCYFPKEQELICSLLDENGIKELQILNTHCHIDHIFGNAFLKSKYPGKLLYPEGELYNLERSLEFAAMYGLKYAPSPEADAFIGKEVIINDRTFEVLFTPGHSSGHLSFYDGVDGVLFSGDVIFQNSIGRHDLPGGNLDTLMETIKNRILILPNNTRILSGHGPETTVGAERQYNPFILEYIGKDSTL